MAASHDAPNTEIINQIPPLNFDEPPSALGTKPSFRNELSYSPTSMAEDKGRKEVAPAMEIAGSNKRSRADAAVWSDDSSPPIAAGSKQAKLDTTSSLNDNEYPALPTNQTPSHGMASYEPRIDESSTSPAHVSNTRPGQSSTQPQDNTLYIRGTNGCDILSNPKKIWSLLLNADPRLTAAQITKMKSCLKIVCIDPHQYAIISKLDRLGSLDISVSATNPSGPGTNSQPRQEVIIFGVDPDFTLEEIKESTNALVVRRLQSSRARLDVSPK